MREIKFRGQTGTTEGKKWVYGHYYRVKSFFDDNEGHYINTIRSDHLKDYNVYKETVGQFTGLKDKNGKEIYEGDIIEFSYDVFTGNFDTLVEQGEVVFTDGAFYIEVLKKDEWFLLYTVNIDELEVIGNIYDNPELLEDKK